MRTAMSSIAKPVRIEPAFDDPEQVRTAFLHRPQWPAAVLHRVRTTPYSASACHVVKGQFESSDPAKILRADHCTDIAGLSGFFAEAVQAMDIGLPHPDEFISTRNNVIVLGHERMRGRADGRAGCIESE